MLHVPDADATYARAVERSATALRPVTVNYGARGGSSTRSVTAGSCRRKIEIDDVPVEDAPAAASATSAT